MKAFLLLYDGSNSTDWKDYIKGYLMEERSLKLEVTDKDMRTEIADIIPLCSLHSQVIILVSNSLVEVLMTKHAQMAPCLQNHPCVSVIGLYQNTDYIASKLQPLYSSSETWNYFNILDNDETKVTFMISQVMDLLEEVENEISTPVVSPMAPKEKSVGKISKNVKTLCPSSVRQSGEKVVIVLHKPMPAEKIVQVQIAGSEKIIETEKLNDLCYSFKAPAHRAGSHSLYILLDGKKLTKLPIHYSAMCSFAYTFPEYLCQLIGLSEDDNDGLDQHLTNIFKSSTPQDGSLEILLTPKNISVMSSAGSQSDDELPTLLHFACKYNLNNLAASIVDTKGSFEALRMSNRNGKTPLDLATDAENEELVNYIKGVTEMQDYMLSVEEIYEWMSGKQLPYMNNPMHDSTKQHYLKMDGRFVEEAYEIGRVPNAESLYEYNFGKKYLAGVSEVQEDEDVTLSPVLPPRLKRPTSEPEDMAPPIPGYSPLIKESCNMDVQRRPGMLPCLPDHGALPKNDPMGGPDPLSPASMGSSTLDDLTQYQEAFKRGEFTIDDMERLYHSWQDRNRDASSTSLKERKKQLEELKSMYQPVIQSTTKGFFSRMTKKIIKPQIQVIEHHVPTTMYSKYETWAVMKVTDTNRDSTISTTSTTSSSSSGSQDSALGTVPEVLSNDDDMPPPIVPRRKESTDRRNTENRKSYGEQFLQSVQNRPHSRLPKPPMQSTTIYPRSNTLTRPKPPPRP